MIFEEIDKLYNNNSLETQYELLLEIYDKAIVDFYMYDKYNYLYRKDKIEPQINRNGQITFKKQLIERYKCCIISKNTENTCDGAHIIPYSELKNGNKYDIDNGLLLRTDLHRYFDNKILKINPITLIASFDKEWLNNNKNYEEYNNIKININKNSIKYLIEFYKKS
jgi:hypothetical protein